MGNAAGVRRDFAELEGRQLLQSGRAGLKQAGRVGRKPKLSASQLRKIERSLRRRPRALGYASGLCTAGRVCELIENQHGVRYHEAHVWRILRQLGWSCQVPPGGRWNATEDAIRYWKRVPLRARAPAVCH
jgi:transposase